MYGWLPQDTMLAILVWSILESAFLPIPAEAVIIPYVAISSINPIQIAMIGSIGSLIGSIIDYLIGFAAINKLSRIFGIDIKDKASKLVLRYKRFGQYSFIIALAIGRLFPLSLKPLMFFAGAIRFKLINYVIVILICSFIRYYIAAAIGENVINLLNSIGLWL